MWPQCGASFAWGFGDIGPGGAPGGGVKRVQRNEFSQRRPQRFINRNLIRKTVLTPERAEAYIGPLDATPTPWRDAAFLKPLTVHTVKSSGQPLAMSDAAGFDGSTL
jgi:hypothetical protein